MNFDSPITTAIAGALIGAVGTFLLSRINWVFENVFRNKQADAVQDEKLRTLEKKVEEIGNRILETERKQNTQAKYYKVLFDAYPIEQIEKGIIVET